MEPWQIILAIIIVGLSIVMPIYYSYKKKKLAQQLKEGREVTEREKINEKTFRYRGSEFVVDLSSIS